MRLNLPKSSIDLLKGHPNTNLLPVELIKKASIASLSNPDTLTAKSGLHYGPDAGYQPLRENIASWLSDFYKGYAPVTADRICITGGASQNLACVLQVYSDPIYTRNIWLVSPTYFHASRMFEDSGFAGQLKSVPEDEEGIDLEYLAKGLKESEDKATREDNVEPVGEVHV